MSKCFYTCLDCGNVQYVHELPSNKFIACECGEHMPKLSDLEIKANVRNSHTKDENPNSAEFMKFIDDFGVEHDIDMVSLTALKKVIEIFINSLPTGNQQIKGSISLLEQAVSEFTRVKTEEARNESVKCLLFAAIAKLNPLT